MGRENQYSGIADSVMMFEIIYSGKFKRDYRLMKARLRYEPAERSSPYAGVRYSAEEKS